MHWLGLLDVLRKGAAFSLRNNDAETFDLARSSVVDELIAAGADPISETFPVPPFRIAQCTGERFSFVKL